MYNHAFRPGSIGGLTLSHRIVMGPMHLNLETLDDDGAALAAFYAERAHGGAGLIITGGVAVNPQGAGGPGYAIVTDPSHRAALSRAARAVHEAGGLIALQLFHAGRYALPGAPGAPGADGAPPLAPSAVHSRFSRATPREMTVQEIDQTISDFAFAARTAVELGFDGVEVMGSEGYLINQFTAPMTNRREDEWGADAVRRRRFPVEVLRTIRAEVGADFLVLFRISGADLVTDGTPPDETAALAVALAEAGADALDVGVGWHESPVPTVQAQVPPATWVHYAREIKAALRAAGHGETPVIASTRIEGLAQANEILAGGEVDFVAMARPFLADPDIVVKSRAGRADTVELCIACNEACIDRSFGTERVSCLVNPRAGHELEFPRPARDTSVTSPQPLWAVSRRRIGRYAVIGAGPAGLEAARTLARLGHRVEVYEAQAEPGGQFRLAAKVPGKEAFGETLRRRVRELADLDVPLHLGHHVGYRDAATLRAMDGVVLASGVLSHRPTLPGIALPHVVDYPQAFTAPHTLGPKVAIIGGGGIAVDLAHLLTSDPPAKTTPDEFLSAHTNGSAPRTTGGAEPTKTAAHEVTLLRRGTRIGTGIGASTRWVALGELRTRGVRFLTGMQYEEITRDAILARDADGRQTSIPADSIVLAAGQESERDVATMLRNAGIPFVVAGGAASTSGLNAVRATAEGLRAAHRLAAAPR